MPLKSAGSQASAQGSGSEFGRRPPDWRGESSLGDRCSPLEAMRTIAADAIRKWEATSPDRRAPVLIQIRSIQDQISGMHHRNAALAMKASSLSWVDVWSPP